MIKDLEFTHGKGAIFAPTFFLDWCCWRCRTYGPIGMKLSEGRIVDGEKKPPFDDEQIRRFIWEAHRERTQGPRANIHVACEGKFKESTFDHRGRSGDFQFGKYLWRYKTRFDPADAPRVIVREHPGERPPTEIVWPPWNKE